MKKIITAILLFIIVTGCQPDTFILGQFTKNPEAKIIFGFKYCQLDSVEVNGDNGLNIYPGGIAVLGLNRTTQIHADITCELTQGESMRFAFRTNLNDYPRHPSVTFDYSTTNSIISINGTPFRTVDSVKAELNKPSRIHIINDGNMVNVVVNCDTVFYGKVYIPATEYLIIESRKNTSAKLSGIIFSSMREQEKNNL
jgi:hypothetical protein